MPERPQIVVFDLGGVLVRIAKTWGEALESQALGHLQCPMGTEAIGNFPHFDKYQAGLLDEVEFTDSLAAWLGIPAEHGLAAHHGILIEPYPETEELIEDLHAAGLRTGCLSNTNALHWTHMERLDLFPAVAKLQVPGLSHLMGLNKPDPAIYAAYAQLSGLPPAAHLFFDDLEANVRAAREAGWNAHRIDPTGNTVGQIRDNLAEYNLL